MPRFVKPRLVDMSETHARIVSDRVRDKFGAPCEWLSAPDFTFRTSNGAAWPKPDKGATACACRLKFGSTELVAEVSRQLADVHTWCVEFRGFLSGWCPVPVLSYRYCYHLLAEFGIPDPDKFLEVHARPLARQERSGGWIAASCTVPSLIPFSGRSLDEAVAHMLANGLRVNYSGYRHCVALAGWSERDKIKSVTIESALIELSRRLCRACEGRGYYCRACDGDGYTLATDEEF